jgi:glycosyltransferase involved in cell wall biosynthesis
MTLIDAAERLRSDIDNLVVLALCATYPISTSQQYEAHVREQLAKRQLEDTVLLVSDFLAADVARTTLRAADVIVLPYEETEESASGAMRFVLSLERPVVATDLPIFDDALGAYYRVPTGDPQILAETIGRFVTEEPLRNRWAHKAAVYSRKTSWARIAADHSAIYARARDRYLARA